ncbi:beta-carotene 15,15'-monooxygenase [Indiicoccus explosivorum]|uniref:beta-carotene 15,15'-monooxygenase n=1 Tax=Indiicoccus explosivorum TaxID=1917864 RepID=UPI000B4449D5|nr:beta-carotene 15,15'-monooxygenase [Indiicoccus explosivorum]
MLTMRKTPYAKWAVALLLLVLLANTILYRSPLTPLVIPDETVWLVAASLLDLAVVAPLLLFAAFRLSWKQAAGVGVFGLIAARLLIPAEYFGPLAFLPWLAIGFEALLLLAEASLLVLLIAHAPALLKDIRSREGNLLFELLPAVRRRFRPNMLVTAVMSETLTFYYAFFTWKKKAPEGQRAVSLHKNSSAIAFYVMLIHAVVLESVGLHWWLHDQSAVLSIVLLVLNAYTVVYFIAEIQAIRLNPLTIKDGTLHVSLGLSKRISVPLAAIREIRWGAAPDKHAMKFIAQDFEEPAPHVVIDFKEPVSATIFGGLGKNVTQIAVRADDPEKLRRLLEGEKD